MKIALNFDVEELKQQIQGIKTSIHQNGVLFMTQKLVVIIQQILQQSQFCEEWYQAQIKEKKIIEKVKELGGNYQVFQLREQGVNAEIVESIKQLINISCKQMEIIIQQEKREMRVKYQNLARIIHINFIQYHFGKFLDSELHELNEELNQQFQNNVKIYLQDQLQYKVSWVDFMSKIQGYLNQNFSYMDIQTKPQLSPKDCQKIALEMSDKKTIKWYIDASDRINKQMSTWQSLVPNLTESNMKQWQKQLKAHFQIEICRVVEEKYNQFVTLTEKCYNSKVQVVKFDQILVFVKEGFKGLMK